VGVAFQLVEDGALAVLEHQVELAVALEHLQKGCGV